MTQTNDLTNVNAVGGEGDDHLRGGEGRDILEGRGGHDTLEGGGKDDILRGGKGMTYFGVVRDTTYFKAVRGRDTLDGGEGDDVAVYRDKSSSVRVVLDDSSDATVYVGGRAEDTIRNVTDVRGGTSGDVIIGDRRDNYLGVEMEMTSLEVVGEMTYL